MSKWQRTKGAAGEREFFARLSTLLGLVDPLKRTLGQARDGGHDGDCGPLRIEVKRRNKIACLRWMDQCRASLPQQLVHATPGAEPVPALWPMVAMREDGSPSWYVLLPLEALVSLGGTKINRLKSEMEAAQRCCNAPNFTERMSRLEQENIP